MKQKDESIKALSVKQPWAGLIIAGIKTVENRSWLTHYSGRLAIVSTQKADRAAMEEMKKELGTLPADCYINGSILGTVELTALIWLGGDGVAETDMLTQPGRAVYDWWDTDSTGWILERPRRLARPIPYKGRLGLYSIPMVLLGDM
jgi:hypothetical protein